MKLYLTGTKSYQLNLGISCSAFSDPRLERTIQGIKRDHNKPERSMRSLLTRPCLKHIIHHLSPSDYNDVVTWAAFTLGCAGFRRVGEFTYKESDRELGHEFGKWFLTKKSIRVRASGSYMELTIPSSKTDPFRRGIIVTIAASNYSAGPVHAMRPFLNIDTHRAQHAPLFCIGQSGQQAFTREYVVQRLQNLASIAGLGHSAWNGHSFRRVAATGATETGLSEHEIS